VGVCIAVVFVYLTTILLGEAEAAAEPERHLLPHLRPGAVVPSVHEDGDPDARDGTWNVRLPAPQGHFYYRHPLSG